MERCWIDTFGEMLFWKPLETLFTVLGVLVIPAKTEGRWVV